MVARAHWAAASTKAILGLLLLWGCRGPEHEPAGDTSVVPIPPVAQGLAEPVVSSARIDPFTIVLGARGGNPAQDYDYEFNSDGRGVLKIIDVNARLVPSLFRKSEPRTVETRLEEESIQRVAQVLETSLLRTSEGAYGGEFGIRNSTRFHVPRRSIDLITPTGRRRIEFPRIFAWQQFDVQDQEVLLAFLDLWRAVEPTIPDERLRDFTSTWAGPVRETSKVR